MPGIGRSTLLSSLSAASAVSCEAWSTFFMRGVYGGCMESLLRGCEAVYEQFGPWITCCLGAQTLCKTNWRILNCRGFLIWPS